jgi:hypothetical protein
VTVKCDALTFTTPLDGPIVAPAAVRAVLDACGAALEHETAEVQLFRLRGGVFRVSSRPRLLIVSASGGSLGHLRDCDLYGEFLSAIAVLPHRISRLDACLDTPCSDAAAIVQALAAKARAGNVALSRKAVHPTDVETWLRAAHYDPSVITGTVYLGKSSKSRAYLAAYDKQNERLDRGFGDIGGMLRRELRIRSSEIGVTLRDAADPTSLFWHFVSPDVLEAPPGVVPWVSHAEGFTMEKPKDLTPLERAFRLLDNSPDIARLARYALEGGPNAMRVISARLERLAYGDDAFLVPAAGTSPAGASTPAAPTSTPHPKPSGRLQ